MYDSDDYLYGSLFSDYSTPKIYQPYKKADDVRKYRARIKEITRNGMMTVEEKKEIADLEARIGDLQLSCAHVWSVQTLFQLPRQFCDECDLENHRYKRTE